MKQLINIANPNIRIIAEEFEEQLGGYMLTFGNGCCSHYYSFQEWTLSDYDKGINFIEMTKGYIKEINRIIEEK